MIPEELFGKIIKYHLLDQEQEADDIRKGLEKKLDAMVNREVYSKFKTAPTEEEWETLIEYFNNSSSDVEESFKTKHTGIREWDGSFTQSSYGGWWAYSPLGAFANTAFSGFGYMPANTGFSIRCVKTKQ